MSLLSVLRPTPLAFIAFFFSYALQVVTQNELLGLLPYVLLFPSLAVYLLKITSQQSSGLRRLGFGSLDLFVCALVAFVTAHIFAGTLLGGYSLAEAIRLLLIYVVSGWAYFYVSRVARDRGIRSIMAAIAIATTIMSVQWVYETYTKMIRREITQFQLQSYEYQKRRNNLTDEEMNPSTLGSQYRAHGLSGAYTITGTLVAIGAFAMLSLFPYAKIRRQAFLLGLFFVVLLVGFATTALVGYVILFPFVLWLSGRQQGVPAVLARLVLYACAAILLLSIVALTTQAGREVLTNSVYMLRIQVSYVLGSDPDINALRNVYRDVIHHYFEFLRNKPAGILIGEGPVGYGDVIFGRGGDVGVLDLAAGFGIPFTIYFFITCAVALRGGVKVVKKGGLDQAHRMHVVFGLATVAFLLISLTHYAVIFNKAVIIMFYLALGLIRRYGPVPIRRPRVLHAPVKAYDRELALVHVEGTSGGPKALLGDY